MMAQGALHYEILLACPEGLRPPAVYADLSGYRRFAFLLFLVASEWRAAVVCCFSDLVGRYRRFDAQLTGDILERIDKEWARRQAENPALYNGSKFRLACQPQRGTYDLVFLLSPDTFSASDVRRKRAQSREREAADQPAEEPPQIAVQLGLTDYRSFIGTNLHVGWQHLVIVSVSLQWFSSFLHAQPLA